MNWYLKVLKQYVDFNGRARRQEFWMFVLFNMIIGVVLSVIDSVIGTGSLIGGLYSLAVLLPSLGVSVRRLHDIGKSGWNCLWAFLPIVGAILLLVWCAKDGQPGDNQWGPNPKA
ncbi:MAG: DUF805 domain-containing protein [Bacteroidaceae bacterium]|nr:DUF805 domain-containing protein [Bacteroidaceae bacterium]